MAIVPLRPADPVSPSASHAAPRVLAESVRRAPLVPAALALTVGILLDHFAPLPPLASLAALGAGLAAWAACWLGGRSGLARVYLALAVTAFGAGYHRWRHEVYRPDDISHFAVHEPRLVSLRGVLSEEPIFFAQPPGDPLRSFVHEGTTRSALSLTQMKQNDWVPVSGRVRLVVEGRLQGYHIGDEVELVGWLELPEPPSNPGEFDYAAYLRDQGMQAVVTVEKSSQGVIRQTEGWRYSLLGWLAVVRGWGQHVLQEELPAPESGVAMALLLGEGSTMTGADFEKYIRTGVIHILVISGQHLVILAWFAWWTLRLLGVRRRRGAILVMLFLLSYALLTGGNPPVMRAVITVCAFCGGLLFRRPVNGANALALAWLIVALLKPADIFNTGCQLSFLAVAVLYWGAGSWFREEPDQLQRFDEEMRPAWERRLRAVGRWVLISYAASALIWVTAAPLVAARYHLVSPAGFLLTPPLVLLTSVALIAGFLLLLSAAVCWPLVPVFAWVTRWSLAGCDWLVSAADGLPVAYWYVGDLPEWWLWVFYLGLFAVLLIEPLRQRWTWIGAAWLTWFCIGLLGGSVRPSEAELRCTFLAVGHGGCIVLETPDGRVLLYDAGSMSGPDVARKQIAPYLWHRGIRRIDEVILSHAHLDHFNGLAALLDRFTVAQITCTPTFAEKPGPGVQRTLELLQWRGIPVRVVRAGDRLTVGAVEMEVLHPPAVGPEGNEDVRSLVLLVKHAGHSILLTGDLKEKGMQRVLDLPAPNVDVLLAPHHGSRYADPEGLADRTRPEVVISCQSRPLWPNPTPGIYEKKGAHFLATWQHGAVTVISRSEELLVETYRTRERRVIRSAHPP